MSLKVYTVPIIEDNYVFVIAENNECAIVDPGTFEEVDHLLTSHQLRPTKIINTHHHWDHIEGIPRLVEKYNIPVYASYYDQHRIPNWTHGLKEGDQIQIGSASFEVLEVPGHTLGHIAYYSLKHKLLFIGDTLFSLGCGRLFEGTPEQLLTSLNKIKTLPNETQIYCTHEYTETNLNFAETVDPKNPHLTTYGNHIRKTRAQGLPTIPALLEAEKQCNPFLRADSFVPEGYPQHLASSELAVFTFLRKLRNSF